jgi:hypothetical protein
VLAEHSLATSARSGERTFAALAGVLHSERDEVEVRK